MARVFIADDEEMIVESLKASMDWEQFGCRVVGEAYDGDDALDGILRLEPDIVFIDIRMPGMNGLEVIRNVREKLPRVQFIVVSGYSEFEYARKAIDYGVLGYCLKPFDEEELAQVLRKAVEQPGEAAREEEPEEDELGKVRNATFKALLLYIRENYASNPITVQELSVRFSINQSYISQLFKKELGTTFTDYLNGLRIAQARELLKNPALNINEVADRSGYGDYFYFAHIFKKLTGRTPTQYRNELKG